MNRFLFFNFIILIAFINHKFIFFFDDVRILRTISFEKHFLLLDYLAIVVQNLQILWIDQLDDLLNRQVFWSYYVLNFDSFFDHEILSNYFVAIINATFLLVLDVYLNSSSSMHLCCIFDRFRSIFVCCHICRSSYVVLAYAGFVRVDEMIFDASRDDINDNRSIFDTIRFFIQKLQETLKTYDYASLFEFFSDFVRSEILNYTRIYFVVFRIDWRLFWIWWWRTQLKVILYIFQNDKSTVKMKIFNDFFHH